MSVSVSGLYCSVSETERGRVRRCAFTQSVTIELPIRDNFFPSGHTAHPGHSDSSLVSYILSYLSSSDIFIMRYLSIMKLPFSLFLSDNAGQEVTPRKTKIKPSYNGAKKWFPFLPLLQENVIRSCPSLDDICRSNIL